MYGSPVRLTNCSPSRPAKENGVSLAEIYSAIVTLARTRRADFHGVLSLVIWGVIEGVISSEITHSPLQEHAPVNGKSIMDPENYDEWNDTNREPRYRGDTLVSFGIGIDLSGDLSVILTRRSRCTSLRSSGE